MYGYAPLQWVVRGLEHVGEQEIGIAFLDWLRPAESRTHLGKFVQQVLDGDGLGVVGDKLGANLKLVFGTPFSPLVPIALIALIWIVAMMSRGGA